MPRSYEDISFVSIQDGRDSPLTLISSSIQPDSTSPSSTTGTKPKKGVKEEEEKGEKEVEEKKKGKEKKDREREEEEKGDESLAITYGASRVSKMAGRIRNRSAPYSSSISSRSRRTVGVQASSSNSSRPSSSYTPTFWNNLFVGTPKIYKLCSCSHVCPKDNN